MAYIDYSIPIPLAYQKETDGLYRVIYNDTSYLVPSLAEIESYCQNAGIELQSFDINKEQPALDKYRFSKNIKVCTLDELQKDITAALSLITN